MGLGWRGPAAAAAAAGTLRIRTEGSWYLLVTLLPLLLCGFWKARAQTDDGSVYFWETETHALINSHIFTITPPDDTHTLAHEFVIRRCLRLFQLQRRTHLKDDPEILQERAVSSSCGKALIHF
ncbi:hypothetical protein D9C73_016712 [Collichthys lucidus]|uniref:Uncharacterized protein n=1 Tax=Collichthys lucidus TaxID=240159 RepID=A0A4U5V5L3_COLLU|nr:hypothetical protein D9C73_016680 [Collichthys lucidus]TKS82603.1 hypothetical protein D9C73_016712 [Collichthys lucidus]